MNELLTADLIARAAAGEARAFEELVRQYHAQVYRWAVVAGDDPDDAEDIAQQVWIKVYRNLAAYRGGSKFTTWLYRITFNTAVEQHRTRDRRKSALADVDGVTLVGQQQSADEMDSPKLFDAIYRLLHQLPARQRAIFALADLEGIAAGEIAERLEMNEVTVRVTLFKARRAMRERLLRDEAKLIEELRT